MKAGGLEREYRLHLPSGYDESSPASLVLVFHWYQGNAANIESAGLTSRHADKHGYIVVYPESTSFKDEFGTITSWNDMAGSAGSGPEGPTCSDAMNWPFPPECGEPRDCVYFSCHDDLGFVEQLLDELERSLCIDRDRIYATGVSNGAMFAYRLGCTMADRFAAIATVAGIPAKGFGCAPGRPDSVSLMHLHGDHDGSVPTDGSEGISGHFFEPVAEVIDAWASNGSQGCDDAETPYPTSKDGTQGLACSERGNCASGAEVVSCSWDGDHNSSMSMAFPFGNDVIWEFFDRNPKQR